MRCSRLALVLGVLCVFSSAVPAQAPRIGGPAPAIALDSWLNWEADERPSLQSLKGRVIMIEFWGTWCGPCVRAMPHVQELHDRYRERGLTVLAISYEEPERMKGFLEKHAYTMPVGSDPQKRVVQAYAVRSWPTTAIVGKDGRIAWLGGPYGAESAVEKALGLEAGPATLLTTYLDALRRGKKTTVRAALERLVEKAPASFDLRSWAAQRLGPDAGSGKGGKLDAAKTLDALSKAWGSGNDAARSRNLLRLASWSGKSFDLAAWARRSLGRRFPITRKEFKKLLTKKRYEAAVDALVERRPTGAVLKDATKHGPFKAWCSEQAAVQRKFAKKAIMAKHWVFAGKQPRDNDGFWRELAISGMATSEDRKRVTGILIGGKMLHAAGVDAYIERHLARHLLMDALAAGRKLKPGRLLKLVTRASRAILTGLTGRYGNPED